MPSYLDCDFHVCNRDRAAVSVEERAEGDAKREYIVGHAAVFYDQTDPGTEFKLGRYIRERVGRNAFDGALSRPDDVRALFNHSDDYLLARTASGTLTLGIDSKGLKYGFAYDPSDADHKSLRSKIIRGDLTGSSFGFVVESETFEDDGEEIIRTINSVNPLVDVSPVTHPAFTSADSGIARRKQELFGTSLGVYIGQHRDDAGVRGLEVRMQKVFGITLPTEIQPGKPAEWYRRQMRLIELEQQIRARAS